MLIKLLNKLGLLKICRSKVIHNKIKIPTNKELLSKIKIKLLPILINNTQILKVLKVNRLDSLTHRTIKDNKVNRLDRLIHRLYITSKLLRVMDLTRKIKELINKEMQIVCNKVDQTNLLNLHNQFNTGQ
mmetsp:Transcript_13596/g.2166  ORF Transcript_13596/g.2166 Transcript_13596/m.2166 type:complete len:130 (+) Transcript_13596:132-521(+)